MGKLTFNPDFRQDVQDVIPSSKFYKLVQRLESSNYLIEEYKKASSIEPERRSFSMSIATIIETEPDEFVYGFGGTILKKAGEPSLFFWMELTPSPSIMFFENYDQMCLFCYRLDRKVIEHND